MPAYPRMMLAVFALTLFTSATLLMSVQPMIGTLIGPLLGGTPAVWNTCMVFFEVLLLAGYCYAHFTTRWLGVRKQAVVHLVVLALPFLFFPIAVREELIGGGSDNPIPQLLLTLAVSVGVPFFVVSTSAPLLTRWFSTTTHGEAKDPYFLYGASNLGSMIGLLSYPTLIEPALGLHFGQPWAWALCYTVLVLLIGGCAAFLWLSPAAVPEADTATVEAKQQETRAALALVGVGAATSEGMQPAAATVGVARGRGKKHRKGNRYARDHERAEADDEQPLPVELTGNVTWLRRLRWVLLAAVPCSLMLGATTYMTTDIAAISYLWVPPLALYLLSFIIVFAKIRPVVQSVLVFLAVEGAVVFLATAGVAYTALDDSLILALRIMLLAAGVFAFYILKVRMTNFIHVCCVGALPLIVLLLLFMMLSDIKPPKIAMTIGIHLVTLFIVAMVCHGELALDRPPTKYLTEFFLWMSVGGVVGGLFNALIAPVIFNAIVEYQLAMTVACLFLPPLGMAIEARWGYQLDLALTALCLTVGSVLISCRLWENDIPFARLTQGPTETYLWLGAGVLLLFGAGLFAALRYRDGLPSNRATDLGIPLALFFGALALNVLGWWLVYRLTPYGRGVSSLSVAVNSGVKWGVLPALLLACLALNGGVAYVLSRWRTRYQRLQVLLDLALPFAVLVLVVGLIWGLQTSLLYIRLAQLAQWLGQLPSQIRVILTFGVPAVLVYTFAERSTRFGLSVAAVALAAAFTNAFDDNILFQERSFFGVLRVEASPGSRRLVHGTTLHGQQFIVPDNQKAEFYAEYPGLIGADTWPLTYYHRTGPIGQVCEAYNEPWRNLGIIGLGTGTMACYAHKGQNITFYDIDPVIKRIVFDSDKYFTFVQQARDRGAIVHPLVLGDARLTLKHHQLTDDEKYHILVVDAFSSDAIPTHLLTYEALSMYFDKMAEEGIVCFHISNRHLNLKPVLGNLAAKYTREKSPLVAYYMEDGEDALGKAASTWVVLARDPKYLARLGRYDSWDAKVGLDSAGAADTLDGRMQRYGAMREQVAAAQQKLKDDPTLRWDDVKPALKWDATRKTLRALCVPAAALEPHWFPVPVEPSKGEWTDDYRPLIKVFIW